MQTFIDRWDLHDVEILFDVKDKRAVFPIRSNNSLIDATGRSLDGGIPKWFRYTGNAPVYTSCRGNLMVLSLSLKMLLVLTLYLVCVQVSQVWLS